MSQPSAYFSLKNSEAGDSCLGRSGNILLISLKCTHTPCRQLSLFGGMWYGEFYPILALSYKCIRMYLTMLKTELLMSAFCFCWLRLWAEKHTKGSQMVCLIMLVLYVILIMHLCIRQINFYIIYRFFSTIFAEGWKLLSFLLFLKFVGFADLRWFIFLCKDLRSR